MSRSQAGVLASLFRIAARWAGRVAQAPPALFCGEAQSLAFEGVRESVGHASFVGLIVAWLGASRRHI